MPILPNAKHELFAQERAKGKAPSDAYEAAGFRRNSGNAGRLDRLPEVQARIAELIGAAAERAEITIERVMAELGKIGFANMADYISVGDDGDPFVDLSDLDRDKAAAISEVTVEDFKDGRGEDARDVRRVKFKLLDKRAALVDIGKHLGMFKERVEHTGSDGGPIEFTEASETEKARRIAFALTRGARQTDTQH
ncbi:terminase small subunit [Sphingomonas histidinilytica]|uniref:terminase small subunit n=1 Tax=Rhizorhabdus histidinilytica TaxID=439228 RepID=UPI001ADAF591|nr:terminase small subunit [Rhizorhabdus histidinilytica]MBO9380038.1 terminase small subunit [Rhizorhabdus histidinilytica]